MTNTILLSWIVLLFISYVSFILLKYGILDSISESYYKEDKHSKFLFSAFIFGLSIPFMIIGGTTLMILAGLFLSFAGIARAYKEEFAGTVHIIGATGGISLGYASMWIDFHLWYLPIIMGLFALLSTLFKLKYHTWWIEILAFILVIIGLIIK
jgi:surface polysaccharide O-acyltransferase-like enzyme